MLKYDSISSPLADDRLRVSYSTHRKSSAKIELPKDPTKSNCQEVNEDQGARLDQEPTGALVNAQPPSGYLPPSEPIHFSSEDATEVFLSNNKFNSTSTSSIIRLNAETIVASNKF